LIADDERKTSGMKFGRGLTGMSEPVRALDGKLQFAREDERTIVRCSLPIRHEADVRGT
jgi:two-component system sensor histidine kinase UhpB